ncbi:MAG: hypothetical protein SFV17_23580 [Candidatus Obscuribacter sp.]|nr:hypothetical protein [Candidatus Obscuribacter sp.]
MTSDGTYTYEWDAENRLIKINYPGTSNSKSRIGKVRRITIAAGVAILLVAAALAFYPTYPIYLLAQIIGCRTNGSQDYDLRIAGANPTFVFSNVRPNFYANSVRFTDFEIALLDPQLSAASRTVWRIEPRPGLAESSCCLKQVEYGSLPSGWKELVKAEELESDQYYLIRPGKYVFKKDTANRYSWVEFAEFASQVRRKGSVNQSLQPKTF